MYQPRFTKVGYAIKRRVSGEWKTFPVSPQLHFKCFEDAYQYGRLSLGWPFEYAPLLSFVPWWRRCWVVCDVLMHEKLAIGVKNHTSNP